MTFLELRQRVAELAGLDRTQTETDTRVKEWVNQTYQDVSSFYNWPWLVKRSVIQTLPDITTGTVAVTNDSTAITFSSAPSISVQDQFQIQITDDTNWYNISSHTAASTSATLDVPYLGTTNGTAGYKLRKVVYSLPSSLDRVMFIRQTDSDTKLNEIDPVTFFNQIPDPNTTGSARNYYFQGLDTNQNWQIGLFPIPDAEINLLVWYFKKITEMTSDSESPDIPTKFHNILVFGALSLYGYDFIDDTRLQSADRKFAKLLSEMRKMANPGKDSHTILQPWDQRGGSRRGFRLPGNFGHTFPSHF